MRRRKLAIGVLVTVCGLLSAASAASASEIVYRCGNPAELCRISPDGTGQGQLTSDGASAAYQGASLDLAGDRMVFGRDTENLFAADGNAQHVVGPISTFAQVPKISFDGTMVVDDEFYPSLDAYYVCTFKTDGSAGTRDCNHGAARFPAYTPSGQIVASVLNGSHDKVCLLVAGVGCSRDLAVDSSADLDEAAVSPDGQTLAVVAMPAGSAGGTGHIALYSFASGQLIRNLTNGTADETPAWSPDGSKIVFARSGSLFIAPSSGGPGSEHLLVSGGDTPTWGGPPDKTTPPPPPKLSISVLHPSKLKAASLIKHGIAITVDSNGPVSVGVVIAIDASTAHRLGLGRKQLVLAQKTGVVSSTKTFDVTPARKYRHKLGAAKHFDLHVVVVFQDTSGHRTTRAYVVHVSH